MFGATAAGPADPTAKRAAAVLAPGGEVSPPLGSVRVLDFTGAAAGPLAGHLLCSLGADVIKIDSGGVGDVMLVRPPTQNGVPVGYAFYNRGKRSIRLDLRDAADRETMYALVRNADVVLDSKRPGVAERLGYSFDKLTTLNPRIVYATLTAWGDIGPYAGLQGSAPLVEWYSGWASVQGHYGASGEMDRFGALIDHAASFAIVSGVLAGLAARSQTSAGARIDISLLEVAVWMQSSRIAEFCSGLEATPRGTSSGSVVPEEAFECSDGRYLAVAALTNDHFERLCAALELTDTAADPRFVSNAARIANRGELQRILAAAFLSGPLDRWDIALRRAGVPRSRFFDWPSLRDHHAIRSSGLLRQIDGGEIGPLFVPGVPWRFAASVLPEMEVITRPGEHETEIRATGWKPRGAVSGIAPNGGRARTRTAQVGALGHIRVADLTEGLCGPLAAQLLAMEGARVIKVECPAGDRARSWGPAPSGDSSPVFRSLNAGKTMVRLDPSGPGYADRMRTLLTDCDVVLADGARALQDRWQLTEGALRTSNPDLIVGHARYCRSEDLVPDGLGSELIVQAITECCAGLGSPKAPPVRLGPDVAASIGALALAGAVLAALIHREACGGRGDTVEVDQVSALLFGRGPTYATRSDPDQWAGWGPRLYGPPEFGYRTADGRVVFPSLFRGDEAVFFALLRELGMEEFISDRRFGRGGRDALGVGRFAPELKPVWESVFSTWQAEDLIPVFLRHNIVMVESNSYSRLYGAAGVLGRNLVVNVGADGEGASADCHLVVPPWTINGKDRLARYTGLTAARPQAANAGART